MPFDAAQTSRSIAVVGTGISGMAAAWLLSGTHDITVYEREGRVGGHTNTVEVPGPEGRIPVDTGFIVYNEPNYPNLVALFGHLGVATQMSDMSFSASLDDGDREYSGTGLSGLFAQKTNVVRPRHWRMLADILRFYRTGARLLDRPGGSEISLGDFLAHERYSRAFIDDHLLPMAAAVWSTSADEMRHHPASTFIRFCLNHGLMRVAGRPQWRTVTGGSREYARKITLPYRDRIRRACPVRAVRRLPGGVEIADGWGETRRYDQVIIATHADEALAMLADRSDAEHHVLSRFRYARNTAVLHQDPRLMPRRRAVWSSWNYLGRRGDDGRSEVCVSYWMNRLQGLDPRVPLFVTLNPFRAPDPASVRATFCYDHPVFDSEASRAQTELWSLQGLRRTWFCGSYLGFGFHEDGLQAGLAVAEWAGEVRRPWTVAGQSGRLAGMTPAPSVVEP